MCVNVICTGYFFKISAEYVNVEKIFVKIMYGNGFRTRLRIPESATDPYTYNGIHKFAIRTRYANRILKIAFRPLILRILFSQNEPVHITFTQVIFRNHPLSVMTFYPELRA